MSDLVADNNGDITYEPPAGSENSDGSDIEGETAEPVLLMSTAPPPFVRRRGRGQAGQGRGWDWPTHSTKKRAWRQVFALLINDWQLYKILLQITNASELETAICCLWCIIYFNTNLSLFLLVYCVAACLWIIHDRMFLEKILNIFSYASPNSNKNQI